MKICFVDLFMDLTCSGGSMHSLDLYAIKLAEKGHEVSILTFYPKRNIGFDRKKKPYKLIEEKLDIHNTISLILDLEKILKKYECFDIFHIHDPRLLLGAALYRKNGGIVPVVGDLNTYIFHTKNLGREDLFSLPIRFLHRQRLGLINRYVDRLFPVSPYVEKLYVGHGLDRKKMMIIPDGFDFLKAKRRVKRQRTFRLIYLGRLERTKGVDITLRAISLLKHLPLHFDIVGEGPQRHSLEKLTKELGITEFVSFHGFVDSKHMAKLYSNADVFVHAARWEEPFGRAIVEAMSFGLPIIVSDIGAPPWVADGACIKFKEENAHQLSDRIQKLYASKKLQSKLSSAALLRFKMFDVDSTINSFIKSYNQLI